MAAAGRGRRPGAWRAVQILAAGSLLALLLLPLAALLASVSPSAIGAAALAPGMRAALAFTLLASALSLGAIAVLGLPLGYLLARRPFRGRTLVESAVTLPIVLPHLVGGLALLLLFAPSAPLGALAIRAGLPIVQTIWGTVLVMIFVSAPYAVLASESAFRAVDARLIETARSLGASPASAFATVTAPVAARGISAGLLLAWARSVSEIGGFLILANVVYPSSGYAGPVTSPVSVYVFSLYQIGDLPGAAAAASVLVLVAFALFVAARLAARRGSPAWAGLGRFV